MKDSAQGHRRAGTGWRESASRAGRAALGVARKDGEEPLNSLAHHQICCLDIETVPDTDILPAGADPKEFPPLPCHKVVAISMVVAEIVRGAADRSEWFRVTEVRSGGKEDYTEAQLLRAFWAWFPRSRPRVVTWNGRKFDIPVLKIRAMVHGVPADHWHTAGDKWTGYGKRYDPSWHCDLGDVMSDFGASRMFGLDLMASAIGLPGKIGGHGSEVAEMIAEGRIGDVRNYCEGDVLNLFGLYLRWALMTGICSPSGHNASVQSLLDHCDAEKGERPHLGEFADKWRASARPVPLMVPVPPGQAGQGALPGVPEEPTLSP